MRPNLARQAKAGSPVPRPRTLDVVALGEAMVEFNQTRSDRPEYRQGFGGDTSNCAIAAARAGARAAYLTRVGNDTFGALLRALWLREGLDTRAVESDDKAPTGIYFITHGQCGHTFTYRRSDSAATRMNRTWLSHHAAPIIQEARWLHVSGISLAISGQAREATLLAMQLAREAGTRVSFDANIRIALWTPEKARDHILRAMRLCDLFMPGTDDMHSLTGLHSADAMLDWCRANCDADIVLKMGSAGAVIDAAGARTLVPARSVVAVDATGAGDCFCGNLLARLARGDNLETAARWANAAASISVQRWGAVDSLPRARQVRRALASD